ncbi:uncharacterized protein FFFS_15747 [Fusarium fujikuroi]|nr:uncharacterized protein FFFS_15747 [Fusarium fujikuroi]
MKSTEGAAMDGKPRGDVMATFKRKRTIKRFLYFCKERGIDMAKTEECELRHCWDSMVSEQLPSGNDKQGSSQTPVMDDPDDARDAVDIEKLSHGLPPRTLSLNHSEKAAQSEWERMNERHKAYGKCECSALCDSGCINVEALILCDDQTCNARDCKNHSTLEEKGYLQESETENNGKGLYLCGDDAQKGAKLAQYCGSPILGDDLRQLRNGNDNEITKGHYVVKLKHGDLFLDAANHKVKAKYANHSCQPNCELQEWQHSKGLALFLVASKPIKKHDPITFQYHPTDPPTSIRVRFNKQQHDQGVCYCASESCQWPPDKAIEGVLNWIKEQYRCPKNLGKLPLTIDFTFPRNPKRERVTLNRKWTVKMIVEKVKKILESKLPIVN